MSITHNLNLNLLLSLLINCISTGFSPQKLLIEGDCTFRLSNFLITGLCSSSDNSYVQSETLATRAKSEGHSFEIFLFLIPLQEVFFIKTFIQH